MCHKAALIIESSSRVGQLTQGKYDINRSQGILLQEKGNSAFLQIICRRFFSFLHGQVVSILFLGNTELTVFAVNSKGTTETRAAVIWL